MSALLEYSFNEISMQCCVVHWTLASLLWSKHSTFLHMKVLTRMAMYRQAWWELTLPTSRDIQWSCSSITFKGRPAQLSIWRVGGRDVWGAQKILTVRKVMRCERGFKRMFVWVCVSVCVWALVPLTGVFSGFALMIRTDTLVENNLKTFTIYC